MRPCLHSDAPWVLGAVSCAGSDLCQAGCVAVAAAARAEHGQAEAIIVNTIRTEVEVVMDGRRN